VLTGGVDIAFNYNNIEQKTEVNYGVKDENRRLAAFYRLGLNFLDENRLKLEAQYAYTDQAGIQNHAPGGGVTFRLTQDLTLRTMYEWSSESDEHRVAVQLYSYFGL
jgi:hypothetical protein